MPAPSRPLALSLAPGAPGRAVPLRRGSAVQIRPEAAAAAAHPAGAVLGDARQAGRDQRRNGGRISRDQGGRPGEFVWPAVAFCWRVFPGGRENAVVEIDAGFIIFSPVDVIDGNKLVFGVRVEDVIQNLAPLGTVFEEFRDTPESRELGGPFDRKQAALKPSSSWLGNLLESIVFA